MSRSSPRLLLSRVQVRVGLLLLALLSGGAAAVRGQSALDGFNPGANGQVNVVVVQPDGKILLGGDFTTIMGVTRNRIARINTNGTLDTAFNPDANGIVFAIAVQADGKILAAGDFNGANSIGGQARNRIARLDATTGAADAFDPNANGRVETIAVQADGKILAGGTFNGANSIGGALRNRIARLDPATGLADSFDPNASGEVTTIVLQRDGRILVGGFFSGANSIGGQLRNRIARLDPATGLADSFNPSANNGVSAIAVQADGKILAGGFFSGANSIGGQLRNRIARLDPVTGAADSFNPNANSLVFALAVQADGKILVGGDFNTANIGGQPRNFIARLDPTTGLADSFNPNASDDVFAIAVQGDGKVLVGGRFNGVNSIGFELRNRIARLETDGRVDRTLSANMIGTNVVVTVLQPDGKILIGGNFNTILGQSRNAIARLHADGTLDIPFNPNSNGIINTIAVQPDGQILVGGAFSSIGGQARARIARLDAVTGLADSFDPNASAPVNALAIQPDGMILVGGNFSGANSIGGAARNRLARLDPATGLADPSFDPNASNSVNSIVMQADGKILVGGIFSGANSIGGAARNFLARLDATTGLADSFNPNPNGGVSVIAVQTDGRILVGGNFFGANSIGGQSRNIMARLDPITGLADSFNPSPDGFVRSIALQADGKILTGGSFMNIAGAARSRLARLDPATGLADSFDGVANNTVDALAIQGDGRVLAGGSFQFIGIQTRDLFARLTNDTDELQNLTVTASTVIWTRRGSAPQFARVTFESSPDNVNYTSLGNGRLFGTDWALTGLSLPTGQSVYVRARGHYRSGQNNASESTGELVRNAFLTLAPTPTQVVSRKVHGASGAFDIPLPLTGTPGIECRIGGNYQVVLTFANPVSVGGASVLSSNGLATATQSVAGSVVTVDLGGVANAQTLSITLTGVTDGTNAGDLVVPMSVLVGDATGNGSVTASDIGQVKGQSGQPVTGANFRSDVTANGGAINASDIGLVKAQSGTQLPP